MRAKNKRIILPLVLITSGVAITYYYIQNIKTYPPDIMTMSDKFGILKIYPINSEEENGSLI